MHGRVHEHQTELQGHESSAEDHLHQGVEGVMETRMGILLQSELQKSLDDIAGSGSVTADDYDTEY